ncbi:MAG: VanZ family protein [Actinomycetota bacterium]
MNIPQLLANFRGTGPFLFAILPVVVLAAAVVAIPRARRTGDPYRYALLLTETEFLTSWSVLAIVLVGLRPGENPVVRPSTLNLVPLDTIVHLAGSGGDAVANLSLLTGNVLLFAPAAFFLTLRLPKVRIWQVAAFGGGLSLAVEALQLLFVTNRSASIDDVLLNTLGATLGALAARATHALWRRLRAT